MQEYELYHHFSESDLLHEISRGNTKAFARIFDLYEKKLLSFAIKAIGDRDISEDIIQDIFLRIWLNRERAKEITQLSAYLYRSVEHACFRALKRKAREELVLYSLKTDHTNAGSTAKPAEQLISKEVREQIQLLVDRLSPRQREVFLLSREAGLKTREIADQLGIGYESAKSHLAEALKNLRSGLSEEYGAVSLALFVIFHLEKI